MNEQAVMQSIAAIDNLQRDLAIIQTHPERATFYQLYSMMEQMLPHLPNMRKTSEKNVLLRLRVYYLELSGENITNSAMKPTRAIILKWIQNCDRVSKQYYRKHADRLDSLRSFESQSIF
jgi:hypothetical protein